MNPKRWLGVALALVLVVAAVVVLVWRASERTDLERAAGLLPAKTLRATFTDWAGIRAELGMDLDADSSTGSVKQLLDRAFDRDLSAVSVIDEPAVVLHQRFGFSPATLEWEVYGQSRQGAVTILKLPDDTDFDRIADNLAHVGYERPDSETGVWSGGDELMQRIDPTMTPDLGFISLVPDEHLVVASDAEAYLSSSVENITGDTEGPEFEGLGTSGDALAATVFFSDFACEALSMASAATEDETHAANLVEDAGGVHPLTGLVVSALPDRRFRVVYDFENGDQADEDAESRAQLARSEEYADLFELTAAASDGSQAILDMRAKEGSFVLSELTAGPVLLAAC